MMSCKAHGVIDVDLAVGCPDCVELLRAVAQAAHEEVVFTYRHPHAADRGEVWTEHAKTPKFHKAMKAYWAALKTIGEKVKKKTRKKK